MEHILEKIKEFDTIIIHGHIRPDGDCIGSQFGLMNIIKESFPNKNVYVTGIDNSTFNFLGEVTLIDEKLFEGALSICLDCSTFDRLSDNRINKSKYTIKIDHHKDSDKYCDYEYIDFNAVSTTEIISEFYLKYKNILKINKSAAEALYTGLVTDSGNFSYKNITSNTFKIASFLATLDINISDINNKINKETIELLRFKAKILNDFKMTKNGVAYIIIYKKDLIRYNINENDASSLIYLISNIADIYALFIETDEGIRLRLRSKNIPINNIAQEYGGGGHLLASGAILKNFSEVQEVIDKLDKLLKL